MTHASAQPDDPRPDVEDPDVDDARDPARDDATGHRTGHRQVAGAVHRNAPLITFALPCPRHRTLQDEPQPWIEDRLARREGRGRGRDPLAHGLLLTHADLGDLERRVEHATLPRRRSGPLRRPRARPTLRPQDQDRVARRPRDRDLAFRARDRDQIDEGATIRPHAMRRAAALADAASRHGRDGQGPDTRPITHTTTR